MKLIADDVMAEPAPVVVTAAGAPVPVAVRLNWSAAARRPEPERAFWKVIFGALPALVKVQVICAAGSTLAAGMASSRPVSVPKVPTLPVTAELASVQLALVIVNRALAPSEICTTEFKVVTLIAVGEAGAGVPAVIVVMLAGAEARFATAKVKGPPGAPVVVFRTATVAGIAVLVMMQLICAAGSTLAAGTVSTLPARLPKLAGLPVKPELASLQVAEVAVKLALAPSVICTCVLVVVT